VLQDLVVKTKHFGNLLDIAEETCVVDVVGILTKLKNGLKSRLLAGALTTAASGWLGLAPGEATVLNPGDTGMTPDALTLNGYHTGIVASISGVLQTPFFSGTYSERVFDDPDNVWGARDLTWIINVTNSKGSLDSIGRIVADSFTGSKVDVGYEIGHSGHISSTVDRVDRVQFRAWHTGRQRVRPFGNRDGRH
jgi:hypothetical protein